MIAEIIGTKKRALIFGCIVISLLIHLTPLKVRIYTKQLFKFPETTLTQQLPPPITLTRGVKPLIMTKQLPPDVTRKLAQIHTSQQPTMATNIPPQAPEAATPIPQPLIRAQQIATQQEITPVEPATTHKIFRAGTGFDAPMTDYAITPAHGKSGSHAKHQPQEPKASPAERLTLEEPAESLPPEPLELKPIHHTSTTTSEELSPVTQKHTHVTREINEPSNTNRLQLKVTREENATTYEEESSQDFTQKSSQQISPYQELFEELPPARTSKHVSSRSSAQKQGLSFLAQENFERMIRDQMTEEETEPAGTEAGYDGAFHGSSQVNAQYGDPRYLHYNSKIYRALQQSMDIVISHAPVSIQRTVLDGVQRPTRIRFALDQDGTVKFITVARPSGNNNYDNLAYKIVQEASFPSIPKSFGLHTTYHNYNILLYDVGPGPHTNIGVSPYLEGE